MRRPVGRPRDHLKLDAILDAAWSLFLSKGVEATKLDAIARHAGVSRVTLYSHFADKAALFEATVEREMERLATTQRPLEPEISLREGLVAFGIGLMVFLTSPGPVSYYNALASELRRHPHLARRFYDQGPAVTLRNLASILASAAERGQIAASALSRRIAELEALIGQPLLARHARGVRPTFLGD
ncbi:MAG: TetR family transcriptional regulator, partial [Beijerinckiaceae bacterium]|nr:TetR family transcriptional regulator [Beijerinckiaceae bacterium]